MFLSYQTVPKHTISVVPLQLNESLFLWYTVVVKNTEKVLYIAFLRGINVGGRFVAMEKLRRIFEDLGFSSVASYIQSGNIFFVSSEQEEDSLQRKIEESLQQVLGYSVAVCIRRLEELEKMMEDNPFKSISVMPDMRFAVMFLSKPTTTVLPVPFLTPDGGYEVIGKTKKELFVIWHLQKGRPSSSYGYLEKKLTVSTTTRFWHTTQKILSAAQKTVIS